MFSDVNAFIFIYGGSTVERSPTRPIILFYFVPGWTSSKRQAHKHNQLQNVIPLTWSIKATDALVIVKNVVMLKKRPCSNWWLDGCCCLVSTEVFVLYLLAFCFPEDGARRFMSRCCFSFVIFWPSFFFILNVALLLCWPCCLGVF